MSRRKFYVIWQVECEIELDEEIIERVDDEWRGVFYNLHSAEDVANHIAYNLVFNRVGFTDLDGWADMKDSTARLVFEDVEDVFTDEIE